MKRRRFLATGAAGLALPSYARAQNASTLRFIPQIDLSFLDPHWTTAYVTRNHSYLVFDTLFGQDATFKYTHQMLSGHVVENDDKLWKLTLRDGLLWHDGERVLARDCVASIKRWAKRDAIGDALMNATNLKVVDIEEVIAAHPGVRGLTTLRRTLALVDGGAESPYESLTRLTLVRAGLPAPETQLRVVDEFGFAVAYLDMGWRDRRVGVEFDGAQHWTDARQRRRDIERLSNLESLGWRIIRVSSDMLRTPAVIITRVRASLDAG